MADRTGAAVSASQPVHSPSAPRLSPAGRAIYEDVAPMALAYQRRLLEGLDTDERATLDRLLTRVEEREAATRD